MSEEPKQTRSTRARAKLAVEVDVEISDQDAVREAADTVIDDVEMREEERAVAHAQVADDLADALAWVIDPLAEIDATPGVEVSGGEWSATLQSAEESLSGRDYATLFSVDDQGSDTWHFTPRTAVVLRHTLCMLADDTYDDADEYSDDPVGVDASLFDRLPQLSWSQDLQWRRQFARVFDDLAHDIELGDWPTPRCLAEELALQLAIADAPDVLEMSEVIDPEIQGLLKHPDDFDWDACDDIFFKDHDARMLYERFHDGIEDPDDDINRQLGIGDMRPHSWFQSFPIVEPRDPRRGFRR